MKTFVLSIERATDRHERIKQHLAEMDINFEFFMGVDAKTQTHPYFDLCREQLSLLCAGKTFPNTKKACFVGHWLLWEKCIELGEPILVLEDDAKIVSPHLLSQIEQASDVIEKNGYLKLSGKKRHMEKVSKTTLRKLAHGELVWWHNSVCLMSAYVITPEGAKRLIPNKNKGYYMHTDIYLAAGWLHGVEPISIFPMPVTTNAPDSYIEVEKGTPISKCSWQYLARKCLKCYLTFRRKWHNTSAKSKLLKTYQHGK